MEKKIIISIAIVLIIVILLIVNDTISGDSRKAFTVTPDIYDTAKVGDKVVAQWYPNESSKIYITIERNGEIIYNKAKPIDAPI